MRTIYGQLGAAAVICCALALGAFHFAHRAFDRAVFNRWITSPADKFLTYSVVSKSTYQSQRHRSVTRYVLQVAPAPDAQAGQILVSQSFWQRTSVGDLIPVFVTVSGDLELAVPDPRGRDDTRYGGWPNFLMDTSLAAVCVFLACVTVAALRNLF